METAVGALVGVTRVDANPLTGSLLVEHDGAPGREAAVWAALNVILPPANPEPARLLHDLQRLGGTLDETARRSTNGWLDLKTAITLVLGVYGLSRLFAERPFRPPSGLTLVWWAYMNLRELLRAGVKRDG